MYGRMCFRCDVVAIDNDKEKVMELQKGHSDWDPRMTWVNIQQHSVN